MFELGGGEFFSDPYRCAFEEAGLLENPETVFLIAKGNYGLAVGDAILLCVMTMFVAEGVYRVGIDLYWLYSFKESR